MIDGIDAGIPLEEQKRVAEIRKLEKEGYSCLSEMIRKAHGEINNKTFTDYFIKNGYGNKAPEINSDVLRIISIISQDYDGYNANMNSYRERVHPYDNVYTILVGKYIPLNQIDLFFSSFNSNKALKLLSYCNKIKKEEGELNDTRLREVIADAVQLEIEGYIHNW